MSRANGHQARVVLTLVTDRQRLTGRSLPSLLQQAALAGVDVVQIREKDLEARELRILVAAALRAVVGTPTRIFVNSRPDVAETTGAHGVQLPEDGLPVAEVRRSFPGLLLGVSCHSVDGARRAEADGADFVLLGPVFPTPGKEAALGLAPLAEAARAARIPVHAIGGIEPANARAVLETGAQGLAAIRAYLKNAMDDAVKAFRRAAGEEGW